MIWRHRVLYVTGNEQTGLQTEPICKKFKRRNYSVYSSTF